jgi:hypothetical protein
MLAYSNSSGALISKGMQHSFMAESMDHTPCCTHTQHACMHARTHAHTRVDMHLHKWVCCNCELCRSLRWTGSCGSRCRIRDSKCPGQKMQCCATKWLSQGASDDGHAAAKAVLKGKHSHTLLPVMQKQEVTSV